MSEMLIRERGRKWNPLRLGRSLPIAAGMRRARWFGTILALVGLFLVLGLARQIVTPPIDSTDSAARDQVHQALAQIPQTTVAGTRGLPVWDPGGDLGTIDRPKFLVVRDAGLMRQSRASDPGLSDPALLSDAHDEFEAGRLRQAMALYTEATLDQPRSWPAWYHGALTRARQGKWSEASTMFKTAHTLLDDRFEESQNDPEYLARLVATRYSLGLSLLREERRCEEGIKRLKDSIYALKIYVRQARKTRLVLASDENDLFPIRPFVFDSYQIRNALIEGYLQCQRYPEEYFKKWAWAQSFHKSEYDDPAHIEIQEGPFPQELSACIEEAEPGRRCWALSNLNQLYYTSRDLLPFADDSVTFDSEIRDSYASLVQMTYNIAVLTADPPASAADQPADEPEDENAAPRLASVDYLEVAARLNEHAQDAALTERIDLFGRHLASASSDFRLLALPYRNIPTERLVFQPDSTPEQIKGMAGALRDRFEGYLSQGKPERIHADFEVVRGNLTDRKQLKSLEAWRRQVEHLLQDTLARAVVLEDQRGQTKRALTLRYFRDDFLGKGWSWKSFRTWMTAERSGVLILALGLYLALLTLGILIHRRVVYPFLMYTASFYQTEFQRRHAECKEAKKAFTGEEIREREERTFQRYRSSNRPAP